MLIDDDVGYPPATARPNPHQYMPPESPWTLRAGHLQLPRGVPQSSRMIDCPQTRDPLFGLDFVQGAPLQVHEPNAEDWSTSSQAGDSNSWVFEPSMLPQRPVSAPASMTALTAMDNDLGFPVYGFNDQPAYWNSLSSSTQSNDQWQQFHPGNAIGFSSSNDYPPTVSTDSYRSPDNTSGSEATSSAYSSAPASSCGTPSPSVVIPENSWQGLQDSLVRYDQQLKLDESTLWRRSSLDSDTTPKR